MNFQWLYTSTQSIHISLNNTLIFIKTVNVDGQHFHFSMLKYILKYYFQSSKVGENRDF